MLSQLKYSLADLFSSAGIVLAILSLQQSINGHIEAAIWFILLALLLDYLDGIIARKFGSSSIGKELDSFSDFVTSGIATPFLLYSVYPQLFPVLFLFPICAAIRLAKFNIQKDLSYFSGIPTFISTLLLISLFKSGILLSGTLMAFFILAFIALSMISTIKISSFKKIPVFLAVFIFLLYLIVLAISAKFFWPLIAISCLAYVVLGLLDQILYGNLFKLFISKLFNKSMELDLSSHKVLLLPGVHVSSKDTTFFCEVVQNRIKGNVLEIGTGNGLLPILIGSDRITWTCTDITENAIKNAHINFSSNNMKVKLILSDVFKNVDGKFDYILWNFPYIVGSGDLLKTFLYGITDHLNSDGKVIFSSSLVLKFKYPSFEADCAKLGLRTKIIAKGWYFFIPIYAYELSLN